jgi:hypothetical protein
MALVGVPWRRLARILLVCAAVHGWPEPAYSGGMAICDAAASRAARETDVPLSVLRAVTRTETGRQRGGRLSPWPWTVNMEGTGHWFASKREAHAHVMRHHDNGARSFDIGCFQINYKWHGEAFDSILAMFDPVANARYAARFLARLHAELGDWSRAAGAYHSRTRALATRYRARFDRIRAALPDPIERRPRRGRASRSGPLQALVAARRGALVDDADRTAGRGSLMPLSRGDAPALIPEIPSVRP